MVLGIALSTPLVQTKIAQYVTSDLNKTYGTDINIDGISATIFGSVKLKRVFIRDHHKDTLIYSKYINVNILDFKKMMDGDLFFKTVRIDGLIFKMKTYKGERDTNFDVFIDAFDDGTPSTKKFLLKANEVIIKNSHYSQYDYNLKDPKDAEFSKINTTVSNFQIYGPDVNTTIEKMSFLYHKGIFVRNLSSKFSYTKKHIIFEKLDLTTNNSLFIGNLAMFYDREDFQDFNNKVKFDIKIDQASIGTNDIRCFYNEIAENQYLNLNGHITGPLNNLYITNLILNDNKGTKIVGAINFKNLLGNDQQPFYMNGNFKNVSSDYEKLTKLLPNVLGKTLPTSLSKLGKFKLQGKTIVTTNDIDADVLLQTEIGAIKSKLKMSNFKNIDNANYKGNVILSDFNVGYFLDKKDLGKVSLNLDIDGKGFKQKYLNTSFVGDISKLNFKGYNYTKIIVDGSYINPIFKGKVFINDPNLFLDFDGIANLGKKDIEYVFDVKIDYANLVNLKLNTKDSISVFKGYIKTDIIGSGFDDLKGDLYISNVTYQNNKNNYFFENFEINSSFDANNERTIAINSPDIIEGKMVGKFKVNQLGKLAENALGSIYTNYKPYKVSPGQYVKFNFTIYEKIVEVFFPDIKISNDTDIRGTINSDKNEMKLSLNSKEINAYQNKIHNLSLKIDNKNPLYNAYISLDSLNTSKYKLSDLSLINVTSKDTMYVRSEFKGGDKGEDYYNINLFHTISKEGKNVIGAKKSELKYKDYLWYINEKENDKNKIVFDKDFNNVLVEDIQLTHENQKISLIGELNDLVNKDFYLNFENIELDKVLPTVDQFKIKGVLNGSVNLKQSKKIYQPTSSLSVDSLTVNNVNLGKLSLDIKGDNSLIKYAINSSIENENLESFSANGNIEIKDETTMLDLDLILRNFNLEVLSPLGDNVISNIRGFATGSTNINGELKNSEINGRLYLTKAGLKIPYLNTDYDIKDNAIVDITEKKFIIRNTELKDIKNNTTGKLSGSVEHKNFSDWNLNLAIKSKRLLILDTQDSEDAAYYGTAYIDGVATIEGPTDALFIKVIARSEEGTTIKIPINDADAVSENSYITFVTEADKYNLKKGIKKNINYNGLELEFDLDINPKAEIEVILDRESGHGMKGRGNGTLLLKINTLGRFDMYGDFIANEGTYNFKYKGIVNKKFDIKKGSTVIWDGDPLNANLNIDAVYSTYSNPAVLLDNPAYSNKVQTDVVIGLKGSLNKPEPDFQINFPTVNSVLRTELETALADENIRQKQSLVLLSTGSFLSADGINASSISATLASEKAGDIFKNVFKGESDDLNIGLVMIPQDNTAGQKADGTVGVSISTKINDRISVNGKLGVPVGGINDAAVVGDIEVLYRVNEDGSLNLRMFNKESNNNYVGEQIGYTQGVGINYQVDFDTFRELVHKIFKDQKLERADKKSSNQIPDSNPNPVFVKPENQDTIPTPDNDNSVPE
ncbi:MAG TPA: translocation/assembly module TamB domain-containing protein [Flavobacterium sp.]|nr:translocation/assembly module TamB domain-containing protein [Flavobacterium sp.]